MEVCNMGTIKIGSAKNKVGITVNPSTVLFNGNNVKKIMSGENVIWDDAVALIPVMTSNTTPSGVASASGEAYGDYKAYLAFNGTNSAVEDCWAVVATTNQWLQYKFPTAKTVTKIVMTNRNCDNPSLIGSPKSFKLQGSNDGTTWTDIQSFTNTNNDSNATTEYNVTNTKSYLYYRLYVNNIIGSYTLTTIGKLQYYGH